MQLRLQTILEIFINLFLLLLETNLTQEICVTYHKKRKCVNVCKFMAHILMHTPVHTPTHSHSFLSTVAKAKELHKDIR